MFNATLFAQNNWGAFLRVGPMIAVVMAPLMLFFAVEELSQSTDDPWWIDDCTHKGSWKNPILHLPSGNKIKPHLYT